MSYKLIPCNTEDFNWNTTFFADTLQYTSLANYIQRHVLREARPGTVYYLTFSEAYRIAHKMIDILQRGDY